MLKRRNICFHLPGYLDPVSQELRRLESAQIIDRLAAGDPSVWFDPVSDPAGAHEFRNRVGWIDLPLWMERKAERLASIATELHQAGFTDGVLIGMGGSSLAPEVFAAMPRPQSTALRLQILDTTNPDAVTQVFQSIDWSKTVFFISSKSGTTLETSVLAELCYERVAAQLGPDCAGQSFVAMTDPGTPLVKLAMERGFRHLCLAPPTVGGRYSVFSVFGLLPAAFLGISIPTLLHQANAARTDCLNERLHENPAAFLGATLGTLARAGIDKLHLIASQKLGPFCDWVEQLIAESSGKQQQGIIPLIDLTPRSSPQPQDDAIRCLIRFADDVRLSALSETLGNDGRPLIDIVLSTWNDLFSEFYRWEIATAIACATLKVNPFDQPDVEASKHHTRKTLAQSIQSPTSGMPSIYCEGIHISSSEPIVGNDLGLILHAFIHLAAPGGVIALQAFLPPTDGLLRVALVRLREQLISRYRLSVTLGFGPRFLHSTGQLHKGYSSRVSCIQLTARPTCDIALPGKSTTLGMLHAAQATGDDKALRDKQVRVLRLALGSDLCLSLQRLEQAIDRTLSH